MCSQESKNKDGKIQGPDTDLPLITVFVPCLNEEQNIVPCLETIADAMCELGLSCEVLIFDDHSIDGTVERTKEYQELHPEMSIRLTVNPRTIGLGCNYVEGAYTGRGKYYMLINGDNAESKETLLAILAKLGEADMIIPYFGKQDYRPAGRRVISALFTWLINLASGNHVKYYNGPVLHLRYNVMRWGPERHGFAYQAEIITRLLERGATYKEVHVVNVDRKSGISKAFTCLNFLSVSHSLLEIVLRRVRNSIFQ